MLARTYALLEAHVAVTRPTRLVLVRRFLIALERALESENEREGAVQIAASVFALPESMLELAAGEGALAFDVFVEEALRERLAAVPEGLEPRADWLVRWTPLVEALVPDGPHGASPVSEMVTLAPELVALFTRLGELARSSWPLLLEGQPGTGRESFARVVHGAHRSPQPFLDWDCAQGSEEESAWVIFGQRHAPGILAKAGLGTVFLRNADALSPRLQHRLARTLAASLVLDESGETIAPFSARLISSASRELLPDLLWRAGVLRVHLPPLAERGEDLAALYRNVVRRHVLGRSAPMSAEEVEADGRMALSPRALLALHAYRWPGNVAEFVSVVCEARQRAGTGPVELVHLPERVVAALGGWGTRPGEALWRELVSLAPESAQGPEGQESARRRLRAWRDDMLGRVLGREVLELLARAVAAFNALREGSGEPLPLEMALVQVRASVARELLLPSGISAPLFLDERNELVAELEALALAQQMQGPLARRLLDLGRMLVESPAEARAQLQSQYVEGKRRQAPVVQTLLTALR